jgi:hypothetical protein
MADEAELIRVEDARRHQVETELPQFVDHRVASIAPCRVTGHHLRPLGQQIHHPPLPIIPPLSPDHHLSWNALTPHHQRYVSS